MAIVIGLIPVIALILLVVVMLRWTRSDERRPRRVRWDRGPMPLASYRPEPIRSPSPSSSASVIAQYPFDASVARAVRVDHPHLNEQEVELVMQGLRQWLTICLLADGPVSMPSRSVDSAWHGFVLSTVAYRSFCDQVYGRYLDHHPAEVMRGDRMQDGLRRTWQLACRLEGISSSAPATVPLVFALDDRLAIVGGYRYRIDCRGESSPQTYCVSHIGCAAMGSAGSPGVHHADPVPHHHGPDPVSSDAGSGSGASSGSTSSGSSCGGGCGGGGD
jgi:hypothetical protein